MSNVVEKWYEDKNNMKIKIMLTKCLIGILNLKIGKSL